MIWGEHPIAKGQPTIYCGTCARTKNARSNMMAKNNAIVAIDTSHAETEVGALWEDIKLDIKHFADIEPLTMVGDKKWQHGMATFCKPFTKATIRYFHHTDAAAAQQWLGEA